MKVALSNTQNAAENRQARVALNMRHQRADRDGLRQSIVARERDIENVTISRSGLTLRWAVPRQIPEGPHADKWCIPVPADESRRFQRDPRIGETTERPAPEWAGAQIVQMEPEWFSG